MALCVGIDVSKEKFDACCIGERVRTPGLGYFMNRKADGPIGPAGAMVVLFPKADTWIGQQAEVLTMLPVAGKFCQNPRCRIDCGVAAQSSSTFKQ
jgi:hypothetical protein